MNALQLVRQISGLPTLTASGLYFMLGPEGNLYFVNTGSGIYTVWGYDNAGASLGSFILPWKPTSCCLAANGTRLILTRTGTVGSVRMLDLAASLSLGTVTGQVVLWDRAALLGQPVPPPPADPVMNRPSIWASATEIYARGIARRYDINDHFNVKVYNNAGTFVREMNGPDAMSGSLSLPAYTYFHAADNEIQDSSGRRWNPLTFVPIYPGYVPLSSTRFLTDDVGRYFRSGVGSSYSPPQSGVYFYYFGMLSAPTEYYISNLVLESNGSRGIGIYNDQYYAMGKNGICYVYRISDGVLSTVYDEIFGVEHHAVADGNVVHRRGMPGSALSAAEAMGLGVDVALTVLDNGDLGALVTLADESRVHRVSHDDGRTWEDV